MGFKLNQSLNTLKTLIDLSSPEAFMTSVDIKGLKEASDALKSSGALLNNSLDLEDFVHSNKEVASKYLGPVMGRMPGFAGDIVSTYIDPDYNTLKQVQSKILEGLGPYRKNITGAAAPVKELEKYINPKFPQLTDSYQNFIKNNRELMWQTYNSTKILSDYIQKTGDNPAKYLPKRSLEFIQKIDAMPEDYRKLYFYQIPKKKKK